MSKNICYLSLLLCMVFVSNAMEQIEEVLSPAVRHDLESARSEQPALTDYIDRRMLATQARQRLAAAQDLHTLGNIQALQGLVCTPSREQEVDWHLPVDGDSELHTAIRKGNADGDDLLHVLLLHSQGAGINARNKRGDTPLLLASQTDRSDYSTPRLFRYPLDVNARNAAGFTALYYAIKKNDDGCMEMLLNHGADPKFVDEDGNTLLHTAAQSDAFYSANHLARYKLNPNQLNKYKLAPLHVAILKNFEHTAHSIIWLADTNPNIPMAGESPLIFAIRNELLAIIRDLVRNRADVNARDAMGNSALDLALTRRDNTSIMSELLEHGADPNVKDADGDTPLARALKNNDRDAVRTLIAGGASPNIPDANGVMPIFLALWLKNLDSAALLLEHGADPNVRDSEGNTPLARALNNNDVDAAHTLIAGGANPNIPGANGVMPLARALNSNDIDAACTLIEGGANPNIPDANGVMPIFHILRLKNLHCAARLVELGADPNVRDAEGNTPLHFAVEFENLVSLLISRGARIDIANIHGDTPLHCVEPMTPISAYVLRLYGADINLKNNEGLTPYEKAINYRRRGGSIDGRLLRILEPARSYRLLSWHSSDQPKTALASARDYGITLAGLPGIQVEDTRSASFIAPGQDSRIERLDDNDGHAAAATQAHEEPGRAQEPQPMGLDDNDGHAAAAAQAHEEPGCAQEPQPMGNVLTGIVRTGEPLGTSFWEQVAACFCPLARPAEQSHDSSQPASRPGQAVVSPVTMAGGALASSTGARPQSSTGPLLNFDDIARSSDNASTARHRFFDPSQP